MRQELLEEAERLYAVAIEEPSKWQAVEAIAQALQARERRGWEMCRERALEAIEVNWKGCPHETAGCHDLDRLSVQDLAYPEEEQI